MLGMRQAYTTATKTLNFGIDGYHVQNKYFDPKNQTFGSKIKQTKKKQTKKGSYLDDYVAIHGKIPGPGVYDYSVKGSVYQKTKNKKINYPDKKTIFDQMCDQLKRDKRPAPGQYEPDSKNRPSSAVTRKSKPFDRITFLDQVQYQSSVTPGVGFYNPRPQSAKIQRIDRMKPQDWRQKHKRVNISSGKHDPTPFSYTPHMIGKKSFSRTKKGTNTWGNIDRFKMTLTNDKTGPGTYMGHSQWGKKVQFSSQCHKENVYY